MIDPAAVSGPLMIFDDVSRFVGIHGNPDHNHFINILVNIFHRV